MKKILLKLYYAFLSFKICILKLKGKLFSDHVINKYIEKCSERELKFLLNKLNASVAYSANVREGLILDNTYNCYNKIKIEDNCYIGKKVFIDLVSDVVIKKDAVISAGVTILTHEDVGDRIMNKYYKRKVGSVEIGEGAWIGANSIVLAGVKIGKCAVIGAGALVNKDIEDYTVVGGVPARVIKKLI